MLEIAGGIAVWGGGVPEWVGEGSAAYMEGKGDKGMARQKRDTGPDDMGMAAWVERMGRGSAGLPAREKEGWWCRGRGRAEQWGRAKANL